MWENKSFKKCCVLHWSNSWCCEQLIQRHYKWGGKSWGYANHQQCSSLGCLYCFGYMKMDFTWIDGHQWSRSYLFSWKKYRGFETCIFTLWRYTCQDFSWHKCSQRGRRVVGHAIKHFNAQIYPPLALWQYLYSILESKNWLNMFGVIEICRCNPCFNAALE